MPINLSEYKSYTTIIDLGKNLPLTLYIDNYMFMCSRNETRNGGDMIDS